MRFSFRCNYALLLCSLAGGTGHWIVAQTGAPSPAHDQMSPVFLSDGDHTYKYLETIQGSAYASDPSAYRWTGKTTENQLVDTMLEKLTCAPTDSGCTASQKIEADDLRKAIHSALSKPMPTRWEDPVSFGILQAAMSEVMQTQATRSNGVAPHFGTLPINTLNARTIVVPETKQPLMVFNSELFSSSYESLKVFFDLVSVRPVSAGALIAFDSQQFDKGPAANENVSFRMSQIWEDEQNRRRVRQHTQPNAETMELVSQMTDAIEFFVVAHEYGHVVLGHGNKRTNPAFMVAGKQVQTLDTVRTWEQEIDADHYAFELLDEYLAKTHEGEANDGRQALLRLAPQFFFTMETQSRIFQVVVQRHDFPPQPTNDEEASVSMRIHSLSSDNIRNRKSFSESNQLADSYLKNVFSDTHPPAWARSELAEEYYKGHQSVSLDAHAKAYRELGETILNHAHRMGDTTLFAVLAEFNKERSKVLYEQFMKGGWLRD